MLEMSPLLKSSLCVLALLLAAATGFAQTAGESENRIRNFGSSLKPQDPTTSVRTMQASAREPDEIYRIETKIVVSDFLVLDENGRAVKGLKAEDFRLFEDDKPQMIESFSLGDASKLPRSIVLIIDYSGSMLPFIETSIESAKVLVDKMQSRDRMALVTDDIELLSDFTTDRKLLKEKLEQLKTNAMARKVGKSLQFSSLYATLKELLENEPRPIIIFQTDGDELNTLKKNDKNERQIEIPSIRRSEHRKDFSLSDVLKATERSRATVYTIFPGMRYLGLSDAEQISRAAIELEQRFKLFDRPMPSAPSSHYLKRYAEMVAQRQLIFAGIAKFTGGWDEILETPAQANDVYNRILSNINERYVVGYYPTNEAKDGKRRVVRIELKSNSKYRVWGRKSYIAPLGQ